VPFLELKETDLRDKNVKILAALKQQPDRTYAGETPTTPRPRAAHLQLPAETPKPSSAPYWVSPTNFWLLCGMGETFQQLCPPRRSFAIYLLSCVPGGQSRTWDPEASTAAEYSCTGAITESKSSNELHVSRSVRSSDTASASAPSSHLWVMNQSGTTKWQVCRTSIS